MNKLIRLYNQNRGLFIAVIGIIALIIIVIQTLNSIVKQENQAKTINITNDKNSSTNQSTTISQGNTSVITGQEVKSNRKDPETIKKFVNYCNEGKAEMAYDMLTEECKKFIYPSLDHFKNNYINRIFYINRMYTLQNWYKDSNLNTYYIKYTEDVLATGNVKSDDNKGDYITVVGEGEKGCLNINSYVGSLNINKSSVINGVSVTIDKIYMYMDYTILNINIKNNTQGTICLDTKESMETTYLYDENNVKYTSFLNENSSEELQVRKNIESSINIKFNKLYNPESRELNGVVLKDVVLNYDNYIKGTEKKNSVRFDIKL